MKKRSIILVSYLFSIIFLISFISAGIYFSDLNSKYNLGDMIDLNVRIDPLEEGLLLNAILFCNDAPVIEFNNFPNEEGNVNIKLPLNFNTINQANGNCYFSGTYNSETRKSMNFEISKLLIVRLASDAFFVNPGEEIIISGSAEKLNGKVVDGEIEIKIPLLEILPIETVENTEESGTIADNKEKVIYRVQVGFYKKDLSYNIFEGLSVTPIRGNGGTYYYVGALTEHQDALIKQSEMKARGFEDAFIVTFKNGERINISNAIKTEKRNKVRKKKEKKKKEEKEIVEKTPTFEIKFIVQIGVWEGDINEETLQKIASIGGVNSVHDKGILYKYIAGRYNSLPEAEFRKSEVAKNGFTDAFIYAEKDGQRITVKEAKRLLE